MTDNKELADRINNLDTIVHSVILNFTERAELGFKKYNKNGGGILGHIIFISEKLKFWKLWKAYVPTFSNVGTWKFEISII